MNPCADQREHSPAAPRRFARTDFPPSPLNTHVCGPRSTLSYSHSRSLRSQEYILHSPRTSDSLLSQNREGVFGVIGYLGVFVAAEEIGRWCIWTPATSGARVSNLFKATVILWLCVFIVVGGGGVLVSRRSTNLAYAVWSLGVNCTLLLGLACVLALHGNLAVASPGFQAVNKNGLLVFVVANLLTGAVNLGVDTMEVGEGGACCVVGVYIALVVMFGLGVDAFKNRVKE